MHTMWKGSISFGLVSIPIKMFAATEDKDVRFRYLHKTCHSPVKYVKRCQHCNQDLTEDDIVRGFEIEPNRYVIMTEEDFEQVQPKKSRSIDIIDFVQLQDIDPVYYDKSYYLSPEETSVKAYTLLREAMLQTGKIAIAKIVIRSSSSLAALRTVGDALVMETLFYPDEVRNARELPFYGMRPDVDLREMEMATTLIAHLSAPFEPQKYTDDYRAALLSLIEQKAAGMPQETAVVPTQRGTVVDLMQALQQSIEAAKSGAAPTPPAAPRRRTRSKSAG